MLSENTLARPTDAVKGGGRRVVPQAESATIVMNSLTWLVPIAGAVGIVLTARERRPRWVLPPDVIAAPLGVVPGADERHQQGDESPPSTISPSPVITSTMASCRRRAARAPSTGTPV